MIRFTTIVFLIFLYLSSFSQLIVHPELEGYQNLGQKTGFLNDEKRQITISQIEGLDSLAFKTGENEIVNGLTNNQVIWAKLRYISSENASPYLVIDYPNIDTIDVFFRDAYGKMQQLHSGSVHSQQGQAMVSTAFIFKLAGAKKGNNDVYMRFASPNLIILPVKLVDEKTLIPALFSKNLLEIIYIGIALVVFIFNLFLYISTRDKLYPSFLGSFLCMSFFMILYMQGFYLFLSNEVKNLIHQYGFCSIALGFMLAIRFNTSFLAIRQNFPRASLWFKGLNSLWVLTIVLTLFEYRTLADQFVQVLSFLTTVCILTVGVFIRRIDKYKNKISPFNYYTIAWMPFTLALVYFFLCIRGILPLRDYTFQVIPVAGMFNLILLTFAMLDKRFRVFRYEKEELIEENIRLIKERNTFLEEKVKERTVELQAAIDALKNSHGVKDKLFSIIGHDLRSPIGNLISAIHMNEAGMLSPEENAYMLREIKKSAEQVKNTLDNLLNWSLSQMNFNNYKPEPIKLKEFIEDHVSMYLELAKKKKISIRIVCNDDIISRADRNQFALILRNFIDNSIKFTPHHGEIEVGVKNTLTSFVIYVRNPGKGMSREAISRLLEGDEVSSARGTDNEKGTGLGLQLCKEFIRNMDSELQIESMENEYTSFFFELKKSTYQLQ